MESIVGSFRGVASDKRLRRVCGYPQRVMRLVSVFVDIAFCLGYIAMSYIHIIYYVNLAPIYGMFQNYQMSFQ